MIVLDNLRYRPSPAHPHTWPMHYYQIREVLGLPIGKLPATAHPRTLVGNVWVWVIERPNNSRRQHRVMCQCPRCHVEGPAGRLAQHLKACKGLKS